MRWSFAGSIGWSGSVYASRFPLPLVSRMNAVQPCAFCSSCVLSQIFVSNQPSTPAGPNDDHRTSFLSRFTWPELKQVSIGVVCFVFGSYSSSCRPLCVSGKALADG